ncbi:MAG: T9SS type A sorting domain-containing protein [Bacteroidales bacterium]|nr:T9SS type A sorting domain-containing protein [Bacteroidales bacterium]
MYPNPCNGNLFIDLKEISGEAEISILNNEGNTLKKLNSNVQNERVIEIDLSDLPNSIYFLKLETDEATIIKKILLIK